MAKVRPTKQDKKLSYRTVAARRSISVSVLSITAQLYEKSHIKRLGRGQDTQP